jgi:nitrogen fixation protein FixH
MASGNAWKYVPVGLLLLSATIGAVTVWVALRDPSFGVEEDYYQKGLEHDAVLEQARRNAELGWQLALRAEVLSGPPRSRVEVVLRARAGAPVAGAAVSVEAFHVARSAYPAEAALVEGEAGRYAAELPLARTGKWEVRVVAERGGERFTATQQPFVFPAAEPAGG